MNDSWICCNTTKPTLSLGAVDLYMTHGVQNCAYNTKFGSQTPLQSYFQMAPTMSQFYMFAKTQHRFLRASGAIAWHSSN